MEASATAPVPQKELSVSQQQGSHSNREPVDSPSELQKGDKDRNQLAQLFPSFLMVANLSIPTCDTLPQSLKLMGILALDPHLLSYVLTLLSPCRATASFPSLGRW